jgi:large conductance mechanosensitive channel
MIKGFKQFILRGNVVDLAVGVVIGASFSAVVSSLVTNIVTPFIGLLLKSPDLSGWMFTVNDSKFMYGSFLNALISFIIVAGTIYFFVVIPLNALISKTRKEKPLDPTTKKCTECLSEIPIEAKRCAFCTSVLN